MKLEYDFTVDTVNFMLDVLNKTTFVGVQSAVQIINLVEQLKAPKNQADLDKKAFDELKNKLGKAGEPDTTEIATP